MRRPREGGRGPVASGLTPLWEEAVATLKERKERLSIGWTNGPRDGRNSSTRPRLGLRAGAPGRC